MEQAWELFRRGQLDSERHQQLVRDAVKKNLADLVSHGQITSGGRVVIPIKVLKQWRFEFDPEQHEHTGAFPPEDMNGQGQQGQQGQGQPGQPGGQQGQARRPRKGDVLGQRQKGQGQGGPGGDGSGETYLEVEIGVEAVAEILFADMELPRLHRKLAAQAFTEHYKMEDLRKKGAMSNLDKRRTAVENIRRNAAGGSPGFFGLSDEDLRFRAMDVRREPQDQVAVLFVRDRSGSMGEQEKHLTRVLAFWITRFLQFKYQKVAESAFVLFDTSAEEVSEEEFFHRSEGGGTQVSTGFALAEQIIRERFPPDRYNLYVFGFSDGDNPSSDNPQVTTIMRNLLPICNLIGYADIRPGAPVYGTMADWSLVAQDLQDLKAPQLVCVNVKSQEDVPLAMQRFFKKHT